MAASPPQTSSLRSRTGSDSASPQTPPQGLDEGEEKLVSPRLASARTPPQVSSPRLPDQASEEKVLSPRLADELRESRDLIIQIQKRRPTLVLETPPATLRTQAHRVLEEILKSKQIEAI